MSAKPLKVYDKFDQSTCGVCGDCEINQYFGINENFIEYNGSFLSLRDVISSALDFKTSPEDEAMTEICLDCKDKVVKFYHFKRKAKEVQTRKLQACRPRPPRKQKQSKVVHNIVEIVEKYTEKCSISTIKVDEVNKKLIIEPRDSDGSPFNNPNAPTHSTTYPMKTSQEHESHYEPEFVGDNSMNSVTIKQEPGLMIDESIYNEEESMTYNEGTDHDEYLTEDTSQQHYGGESTGPGTSAPPARATKRVYLRKNLEEREITTVEDLLNIEDVDFSIVQAFFTNHQSLENKYRDSLACCIIKKVLQGNFTREMTANDFIHLSNLINQAFPSEIPETYYVKGKSGGNATGKLRNQYLNIRTELAKVGLIQRKTRNVKPKEPMEAVEVVQEDCGPALELLQSKEIGNFEQIKFAWKSTKMRRMADCVNQGSDVYFRRFPILSTGAGFLLLEQDIFLDVTPGMIEAKLEVVKPKLLQKLSILKRDQTVNYVMESISSDEDSRIATLSLIPFLFLPTLEKGMKRKNPGDSPKTAVVKYNKQEAYLRFIPLFPSKETLEEYDLRSFPESEEVRCYIYKSLQGENIFVVKVYNAVYQFKNVFNALIAYYKIQRALNLNFSQKTMTTWKFIETFFFNLEQTTNPQVGTLINELNLFMKMNNGMFTM